MVLFLLYTGAVFLLRISSYCLGVSTCSLSRCSSRPKLGSIKSDKRSFNLWMDSKICFSSPDNITQKIIISKVKIVVWRKLQSKSTPCHMHRYNRLIINDKKWLNKLLGYQWRTARCSLVQYTLAGWPHKNQPLPICVTTQNLVVQHRKQETPKTVAAPWHRPSGTERGWPVKHVPPRRPMCYHAEFGSSTTMN